MNKTIIYYTSNREDVVFEQKIVESLLANKGDLPLISVSQKPMNLGHNICVGDIGSSYFGIYKQVLEGLKVAETEYVLTAESDFLYPPEYFQLEPNGENIYRYDNIWILGNKWKHFRRKINGSEGAQLIKRKYLIELLTKYLENSDRSHRHSPYFRQSWVYIAGENPCISFKTGNGINLRTGIRGGWENASTDLAYWGNINRIKERFL